MTDLIEPPDEEEIVSLTELQAILVVLQRQYDLLLVIAAAANPAGARSTIQIHEEGKLRNPQIRLVQ